MTSFHVSDNGLGVPHPSCPIEVSFLIEKEEQMRNHTYSLKSGIRPSPKFAKKKLAEFAVNVGTKCGHDCLYCSTGSMLRRHDSFKHADEDPFGTGFSIVDPDMPEKVATNARRARNRGVVQLCTTVDAWAPEAQKHNIGRRCLEAILAEPGWTVRILTKNAAVVDDFDVIRKHRDRVLVGLSLTGTPDKESVLSVVEPNASPISERLAALKKAHRMELRTYGMLCPLLPGIADSADQIEWLVRFVAGCGAEEVFAEAVNPRGRGLKHTKEALLAAGFHAEGEAVEAVRHKPNPSRYVANLIVNMQRSMRRHMTTNRLRFLLYPSSLTEEEDAARIRKADSGVVWL